MVDVKAELLQLARSKDGDACLKGVKALLGKMTWDPLGLGIRGWVIGSAGLEPTDANMTDWDALSEATQNTLMESMTRWIRKIPNTQAPVANGSEGQPTLEVAA